VRRLAVSTKSADELVRRGRSATELAEVVYFARYNVLTMNRRWIRARRDAWIDAALAKTVLPMLLFMLILTAVIPPVIMGLLAIVLSVPLARAAKKKARDRVLYPFVSTSPGSQVGAGSLSALGS
jgi:hypothetical protein